MALGLLILVSVGKENIYLSAHPEITFFKISYKKYTNFSIELIPQYFKTTPDFGRKCSVNISKNGDLINSMYIYIELPYIYCENSCIQFKWVDKIGLALINYVEIEIEGNVIDKHYGDWLNIWFELTIGSGHRKSYNNMIGNIPLLNNFSNSKNKYILYIPCCFWFCLDSGLGLPLISIANSEVKINVNFNNFDLCYKISPSYYIQINESICCFEYKEILNQINQNILISGEFISFDPINRYLYYNPIKNLFINNTPIIGTITYLSVSPITISIQNNNNFIYNKPSLLNAYLLINYIYLDNFERINFINKSYDYIIPLIQTLPEQTINSTNNIYKLSLYNPVKLILWRAILISNLNINDQFNYNNNLILKNLVIINSINRMNLTSIQYYTSLQKYQYNFYDNQKGIYLYSFSLYPKNLQPSGTLNFSKIDDAYIQLTMNKSINYQNPATVRCYAITYNIFKVANGIGGLLFNN